MFNILSRYHIQKKNFKKRVVSKFRKFWIRTNFCPKYKSVQNFERPHFLHDYLHGSNLHLWILMELFCWFVPFVFVEMRWQVVFDKNRIETYTNQLKFFKICHHSGRFAKYGEKIGGSQWYFISIFFWNRIKYWKLCRTSNIQNLNVRTQKFLMINVFGDFWLCWPMLYRSNELFKNVVDFVPFKINIW